MKKMNKAELVEAIAKKTGFPKSQIDEILREQITIVGKTLKKKEAVQLVGLGSFKPTKRKAREGVNPATGERIKIKAKTVVKFVPSSNLKKL